MKGHLADLSNAAYDAVSRHGIDGANDSKFQIDTYTLHYPLLFVLPGRYRSRWRGPIGLSCCRFLRLGRRNRSVVFWGMQGVPQAMARKLVGSVPGRCGSGSRAECLFQVGEHLEEGHPCLCFRRRSACTQTRSQNALAPAQTPVQPEPASSDKGIGRVPTPA